MKKPKSIEDTWPASSVEIVPIDRIKPYPKNPMNHPPEAIEKIAASMMEDGVTTPILVDEDGVIIYGHGRRLAAIKNGFTKYPVVTARGWSDSKKRAYRIKDNQLPRLSDWSPELLRVELKELQTEGYDMPLLGFNDVQLVSFMAMPKSEDPDRVPEVEERAVTKRGDIWLCGKHRVMCGNSVDVEDVQRLLGGVKPDIANCDPPYGINVVKGGSNGNPKSFGSKGRVHGLGKPGFGRVHGNAAKAIIQTGVYAKVIGDDSIQTALSSYDVLNTIGSGVIVLWGGNYYAANLPNSRCWLVWDKEITGSFADVELAWTNCDKVAKLFRHQWNGLMKASEKGEKRVHPTQKPVALAEWVIDTMAPKAKSYLDLFLGSGSSLIACERKSLPCFGMEMAELYVDVIVRRWEEYAKGTATLEGDGRTFAEIAKERAKKKAPAKARAKRTAEAAE